MKKASVLETWEKTGDIPKHEFKVGALVEVFEDPMTQHIHEGVAKIVKIHKKTKQMVDCDVRFYIDIHSGSELEDDAVRRQIKR